MLLVFFFGGFQNVRNQFCLSSFPKVGSGSFGRQCIAVYPEGCFAMRRLHHVDAWNRLFLQEARVPFAHEQISSHFEAEPAARHAGRNLEQIRDNTLIHAPEPFCLDDLLDSIANTCVLVSHATHSVDLESSSQDVERVCNGLRDSTRNRTGCQLTKRTGVFLAIACELGTGHFIDHKVEANVWCNTSYRRDDAAI